MTDRLPLSPTVEFESELSDTESHPYLTIFDSRVGSCGTAGFENNSELNGDLSTTIQMWDMTDELSDGFPNESSMITVSSTLTSQSSEICRGREKHSLNQPQAIFSEEEYSQELNGSTTSGWSSIISQTMVYNAQKLTDQDSYTPATINRAAGSSEMRIKNNIYQTICPHIFSSTSSPTMNRVLERQDLSSVNIQLPSSSSISSGSGSSGNEIASLNISTNQMMLADVETDESTDDDLYSYSSTTSEDADFSDFDYSEGETDEKKKKKKKASKKKKSTISSTIHTLTTTQATMVAEGDIKKVYLDGFLEVSLQMPATCRAMNVTMPACKPAYFYEGNTLVRDNTDSSKFFVSIKAVNCPEDFDMDSIDLVVLSGSNKGRGGEMKKIETITDNNGVYHSNVTSHCSLIEDPSGNDLLQIKSCQMDNSTTISFGCRVTTSNNHGDWTVKHNCYRLLALSKDERVIGGLSIPFKVAKNASISSQKRNSPTKRKTPPLTLDVQVSGKKRVYKLNTQEAETTIRHEGKKYKLTLTPLDE